MEVFGGFWPFSEWDGSYVRGFKPDGQDLT